MGLYNSKINKNQSHSLNIEKLKSTSSDVLTESISDTSNSYCENGRRYNVQNKTYSLPNDYEEHSRLNLQHAIIRYIWQGNFSAPVEHRLNQEDTKVLDIG
ncbi:33506_t:CDS:1, partial [Racocetra persica]